MAAQPDLAQRRLALLIATSDYADPALRQLRAPGRDASDLAEVLSSPQIGGFSVQTLMNARCGEMLEAIEDFCADRRLDDLLLIYLSCHGVLDDRGRLYYAATDTRRQRTAATAVAAAWLNERFEDSRARSQIVMLDCCHSGAFASDVKGESDLALEQRFKPHGRGRVVLTASRGTEYSFEGNQPSGIGMQSVFTRAIVDGLRTGDADRDEDGLITVSEIYHYTYDKVKAAEPRQTPELWTYGAEGDVLLARSVRGVIIKPMPDDLRLTLESPRPRIRETAIAELAELLDTGTPGLALTARQALEHIAAEDIPRVAAVAQVALGASRGTAARAVGKELAEREQREREAQQAAERKAEEQARRDAQRQAEEQEQARRDAQRQAEEQEQARRDAQRQAEEQEQARRDAQRQAEEQEQARRDAQRQAEEQEQARRDAQRQAEEQEQARRDAPKVSGFERVLASLAYLLPIIALYCLLPPRLGGLRGALWRNSFIRINAIQAIVLAVIGSTVPVVTDRSRLP